MTLNREVEFDGEIYREEDVGGELIEAMIADLETTGLDTTDYLYSIGHAQDRAAMRALFFGKDDLEQWIHDELNRLGY